MGKKTKTKDKDSLDITTDERLLSADEAAFLATTSVRRIRQACKDGDLPFVRIGKPTKNLGKIRIWQTSLWEWLKENET